MRPKLPSKKPRSRATEGPALVFVDAADNLAAGTEDKDVRVSIRRQAARSGCKRRRHISASEEKIDTVQKSDALVPIRNGDTGVSLQVSELDYRSRNSETPPDVFNPVLVPQLSYNGYETLRVKYSFDITDLTSFTDVDLGRIAYLSLRNQPTRLASLLQKRPSSFLTYLPSRYGANPCLDDAMHCVAARAGQMLGFPIQASTLTVLYAKALNSLNTAIADGEHLLEADVYGATRLLALYELIGLPDSNNWIYHNRAGFKLVELRGPENHKSRFDWMLLKSQGPSIIVDEMYRKQTSIFEAPGWQRFFENASKTETDTDTSLWWEFFGIISFLPGILKDTRILLNGAPLQSQYLARSSEIFERSKIVHSTIRDSHVLYQHRAPYPPSLFDLPVSAESPDRVRLRGFLLYVTMYIRRVQATLSPSEVERATSEAEAQTFAAQALLIENMTAKLDPAMTWHLEQRNALAHSIIQTREEWFSDKTHGMSWDELKDFLAQRWLKWEDSWREGALTKELGQAIVEY